MSNPDPRTTPSDPSPIFAALADPTRLAILDRLSDGRSRSISELAEGSGMSRQAVTKHLTILEKAALVARRKVGRETRFTFRRQSLMDARAYLDHVSRQWDEALDRLRVFAERR